MKTMIIIIIASLSYVAINGAKEAATTIVTHRAAQERMIDGL